VDSIRLLSCRECRISGLLPSIGEVLCQEAISANSNWKSSGEKPLCGSGVIWKLCILSKPVL